MSTCTGVPREREGLTSGQRGGRPPISRRGPGTAQPPDGDAPPECPPDMSLRQPHRRGARGSLCMIRGAPPSGSASRSSFVAVAGHCCGRYFDRGPHGRRTASADGARRADAASDPPRHIAIGYLFHCVQQVRIANVGCAVRLVVFDVFSDDFSGSTPTAHLCVGRGPPPMDAIASHKEASPLRSLYL